MSFLDEDYRPEAPWKQKDKELSFDVTVVLKKTVKVTVPENYDDNDAMLDVYYSTHELMTNRVEDWNIDDIDID